MESSIYLESRADPRWGGMGVSWELSSSLDAKIVVDSLLALLENSRWTVLIILVLGSSSVNSRGYIISKMKLIDIEICIVYQLGFSKTHDLKIVVL